MSRDVNPDGEPRTIVSPPHPDPSSVVGPMPAPQVNAMDDQQGDHSHAPRRFFIGPMPETIAVPRKKQGLWGAAPRHDDEDEDESLLNRLGADHVREFFLRHGGRIEQWGEERELSVRKDILRRWRESGWAGIRRKEQLSRNVWTGKTFEVGDFLGVNMMRSVVASNPRPPLSLRSTTQPATEPSLEVISPSTHTATNDSFVTANSSLPDRQTPSPTVSEFNGFSSTSALPLVRTESPTSLPDTENGTANVAAKSDGALLSHPTLQVPARSALKRVRDTTSAGSIRKSVQFSDIDAGPSRPADRPPASPGEVLQREPYELAGTSHAAAIVHEAENAQRIQEHGDVVLRDRMLVRVLYTKVEGLSIFDESRARVQKDVELEDWAEFMVVWRKLSSPNGRTRKDRLELYEEYSTPGKEWLIGHKDLSFLVPLRDEQTHMTLFSATDMSFALTCAPQPVHMLTRRRSIFASRDSGTNIFVFKCKSCSRAVDWIWQIWSYLGGSPPPYIDIRAPILGNRVRLEIPNIQDPVENLSVDQVIELCRASFIPLPEWKSLLETALKKGQKLALCWRSQMKLDWVWLLTDIDGAERPWAIWYGIALRHHNTSSALEIRLTHHFPTRIVLNDRVLVEPPAVEGYLHHVRANGTRKRVYLTTHDGNIYTLQFTRATPPAPPAPPTIIDGTLQSTVTQESEVRRGAEQILGADSFLDMRSVVRVRRAESITTPGGHDISLPGNFQSSLNLSDIQSTEVPHSSSDDEDNGGEDCLNSAPNSAARYRIRMKRSFELCLRSGQVLRYEAHSRRDAVNWVVRLNELAVYWTHHHRVDARQEMEVAQTANGRRRFGLPHDGHDEVPESTPDEDDISPFLDSFWNWCVLDGCRSIIKSGRLYTKHGLKGQYIYVDIVLVSGHLVRFDITVDKTERHFRGETINLLDAYVCSGYIAMQALPRREMDIDGVPKPKRYQDGLEAGDSEEDTTFMLWYHYHPPLSIINDDTYLSTTNLTIPKLNSNRKFMIFKARSKIERDSWCWAINCELERVVRSHRYREKAVRDTGGIIGTTTTW